MGSLFFIREVVCFVFLTNTTKRNVGLPTVKFFLMYKYKFSWRNLFSPLSKNFGQSLCLLLSELGNLWVAHKLFFPPPPSDFVIVVVGGALVKITRTSLKNLNRPYYSCPKNLVSDSLNVLVMNECPNIIIFFQPCKDGLPGVMKQKATTSSFS